MKMTFSKAMIPTAREVMNYQHDYDVYSSALIGPSAFGETKLFTTAQGQLVNRLGRVEDTLFPTHIGLTTNLRVAGALGSSIGDYAADQLRLDFIGAALEDVQEFLEYASYVLRVNARSMSEGGLRDLPKIFPERIFIARNDTLDMKIDLGEHRMSRVVAPFLVRAVLTGTRSMDIR